jgi:hypothetical protein
MSRGCGGGAEEYSVWIFTDHRRDLTGTSDAVATDVILPDRHLSVFAEATELGPINQNKILEAAIPAAGGPTGQAINSGAFKPNAESWMG